MDKDIRHGIDEQDWVVTAMGDFSERTRTMTVHTTSAQNALITFYDKALSPEDKPLVRNIMVNRVA